MQFLWTPIIWMLTWISCTFENYFFYTTGPLQLTGKSKKWNKLKDQPQSPRYTLHFHIYIIFTKNVLIKSVSIYNTIQKFKVSYLFFKQIKYALKLIKNTTVKTKEFYFK